MSVIKEGTKYMYLDSCCLSEIICVYDKQVVAAATTTGAS